VDATVTTWNQIANWLRYLDSLHRAVCAFSAEAGDEAKESAAPWPGALLVSKS
jgi:hypothetical protein